jgi:hypothetical protein
MTSKPAEDCHGDDLVGDEVEDGAPLAGFPEGARLGAVGRLELRVAVRVFLQFAHLALQFLPAGWRKGLTLRLGVGDEPDRVPAVPSHST